MKGKEEFMKKIKEEGLSEREVLYKLDLSGGEMRVLLCLMDDAETYVSSQTEIAEKTGMSIRTVERAYAALVKSGVIIQDEVGRPGRKAELKLNLLDTGKSDGRYEKTRTTATQKSVHAVRKSDGPIPAKSSSLPLQNSKNSSIPLKGKVEGEEVLKTKDEHQGEKVSPPSFDVNLTFNTWLATLPTDKIKHTGDRYAYFAELVETFSCNHLPLSDAELWLQEAVEQWTKPTGKIKNREGYEKAKSAAFTDAQNALKKVYSLAQQPPPPPKPSHASDEQATINNKEKAYVFPFGEHTDVAW